MPETTGTPETPTTGARITELRTARGWTVNTLATRAGVTWKVVRDTEARAAFPHAKSRASAEKLLAALAAPDDAAPLAREARPRATPATPAPVLAATTPTPREVPSAPQPLTLVRDEPAAMLLTAAHVDALAGFLPDRLAIDVARTTPGLQLTPAAALALEAIDLLRAAVRAQESAA